LWECRTCCATENEPVMEAKSVSTQTIQRMLDKGYLTEWNRYDRWHEVVEMYSHRELSVKMDKLPAISGLAAEMLLNGPKDEEYAAGLLSGDIVRGLPWFPNWAKRWLSTKRTVDSDLPSWSWASYDGPIVYDHLLSSRSRSGKYRREPSNAEVVHWKTTPASLDPCGRVLAAEISISSWIVDVVISEADAAEVSPISYGRTRFFGRYGLASEDSPTLYRKVKCYYAHAEG